ncbi:xanthine dehydrogenase D subunit [Actinokineospora alba]|uniref:Xanthine dehydrogenase D subunit n=1 Tax=Actinokineospora alba TaxID=504798 RepID=A0A1H0TWJ4_9PSEU|nr:xanthine dehydrogenase subunit D [Actinokineospora alba]TDP70758.1 xanthine dehydrogenase molybdenum binding subunit apoprotein [Actinokineospora alba]SDJ15494.1 xanthine dehydrogenase D subunit [Actinokineospora alba]SDP58324.1 xanthine dehydrogenase D subunit [Actinokineospora alba]
MTRSSERTRTEGGVGQSPVRPDGALKVKGEFAYSSDLWADEMLWGATLRSPHPFARIKLIGVGGALRIPGVHAVLTQADVPGRNRYGLEHADQPILAEDIVRYQGEPVAIVAADHPETARRAVAAIEVEYQVFDPVTDMDHALRPDATVLHPDNETGNCVRHVRVRTGDPEPTAPVVVTGEYSVGMQDQAFLGPESGLAVPAEDGGIDLYVATQWLHVDQKQVAEALRLPQDKVRLTLAGVGGAFGAREDLSMQVHACMLAMHTGKPVKMVYGREESFFGHVHRHPARLRYEHGATEAGDLVYVRARIVLDGGAYASSTTAVVANAATLGVGPYEVESVHVDAYGVYTNNPPCGAMRGFGAVQACFAYESQMDLLAEKLGMDPVELRLRNAVREGSRMPTGQVIDSAAPVEQLLKLVRDKPMPPPAADDLREMPGGVSNTTHGEGVVRGVGYGVGIKNVGFSEGFDDYSTARVRLEVVAGEAVVSVHTAAAEVGQGLVTLQAQIARTELGVTQVTVLPADTNVGSAGSSSASRQSYVTGGAVRAACEKVRGEVLELAESPGARLEGGKVVTDDAIVADLVELLGDKVIEHTVEWRHRPTEPLDSHGQGNAHVQYAFAAHRAVVDVDVELGLVRVVELACAQDVGKAMNPQAVEGQIQGGSAQGLGLAVMEEIQVVDGKVRNPSFTDYLIPTILDMPPMPLDVLELADPHAPYGLRGVGEPPTISSTPAIVAAIRAATGKALTRVPVRPEHITETEETT